MPRTFLIVLFIWLATVLLVGRAQAQDHSHVDNSLERFEMIRILPPAKITYLEPNELGLKLEYYISTRHTVKHGSFQVTKDTKIENDLQKSYKKSEWWIIHCICGHVYSVSRYLKN